MSAPWVKLIGLLLGVVIVGVALFEATMQPSAADRNGLLYIFLVMAGLTALAGWWLPRRTARITSLQRTVIVVALSSTLVVGVASAGAAWQMFLSAHDLNLLLVVLGFGVGLGLVLAVTVARPLASDLGRIEHVAGRVADGDLTARTRVARPDELGTAARAIDSMVVQLEQAAHQRELDEQARQSFLAAIGHDLRTPLAALQAAVEALEDGVAPDPDRYLKSMRRDLTALGALVDDLFLLARIEAGKLDIEPIPVDLAELADESIEALEPVARQRGVGLRLETAGKVEALGGPDALSRVIRNLVDNAIRHANTEVVVTVGQDPSATVHVHDDGPGFSPGFLDDAFSSFVRSDPARARHTGGAGLGLAIAKGVVDAHGGRIWADAGPGGRVTFTLPRS